MDTFDGLVLQDPTPNITLSEDQQKACDAVCDWYVSSVHEQPTFKLAGLAGTGKSTILPFVIKRLELTPSNIHYCAYTGKASLVMQSKGLPATTIHMFIYDVFLSEDGQVGFRIKSRLDQQLKLIVVDEASMVGAKIKDDLESFNIPILYVGDHGQLPPVGDDMVSMMREPDIKLERIHRQAEGNAIIKAAMLARTNGKLAHGLIGDTVVKIRKNLLDEGKLIQADQVLCGKNNTRFGLNAQIRTLLGFKGLEPQPNDKLICLRNNWNLGLVNGMIGILVSRDEKLYQTTKPNKYGGTKNIPHYRDFHFRDETGFNFKNLNADAKVFIEHRTDQWDSNVQQFDFGYAITVHKSQGSQFNNLIVFEEWLGDQSFHRLWLYTAITRAVDNLIIIQG